MQGATKKNLVEDARGQSELVDGWMEEEREDGRQKGERNGMVTAEEKKIAGLAFWDWPWTWTWTGTWLNLAQAGLAGASRLRGTWAVGGPAVQACGARCTSRASPAGGRSGQQACSGRGGARKPAQGIFWHERGGTGTCRGAQGTSLGHWTRGFSASPEVANQSSKSLTLHAA